MDDDLRLSRHLDRRLEKAEADTLARRLEAEPELRARFEALRRLQGASEGLGFTTARFEAADVRSRGEPRSARRSRRTAIVAAAVLVLALSHGVAYWLGASDGVVKADSTPIEETEELLERAARLDAGAPHHLLAGELVELRAHCRRLPDALFAYTTNHWMPEPQRRRAVQLSEALVQLEFAFEQYEDPGFAGLMVSTIARDCLAGSPGFRFVPATARTYAHSAPLGGGRFRILVVRSVDGVPRMVTDEGTLDELRHRHTHIEFVREREKE